MTNLMCPRCKHITLKPMGKIKAGPRDGLRTIRVCFRCNYRMIGKSKYLNSED